MIPATPSATRSSLTRVVAVPHHVCPPAALWRRAVPPSRLNGSILAWSSAFRHAPGSWSSPQVRAIGGPMRIHSP